MEIAQWNEHNIDYNAVSIANFLLILIEIRGVVFGRFALIVMVVMMMMTVMMIMMITTKCKHVT